MDKIYDLIIIGGGSAGFSAGIYAGRAKVDLLIIEKSEWGGQVNKTEEILNYPGIIDIKGSELMHQMRKQAEGFGAQFTSREVEAVELDGEVKTVITDKGKLQARSVIIATGASPRKLKFPGEDEFIGRGIAYFATCDGELFTGKEIVVVGAGFAAAEEAMFLTRYATKVTIIAREPEFTCAKTIADKVLAHPKIEVKFNTEVVKVWGDTVLKGLELVNNQTSEHSSYENPEGLGMFIFVGYEPATNVFKDQITLDQYGYIVTNDKMQTNIQGVYAAGDLRQKELRQIVTAVADGAIAATEAEKYIAKEKDRLSIEQTIEAPSEETETTASTYSSSKTSHSFLPESIIPQLTSIFSKLSNKVTLVTILENNVPKTLELEGFLKEISTLSDKIELKVIYKDEDPVLEEKINADRLPVVALLDDSDQYTGVKFHGIPGGHELNSFILAIYNLAGPGQPISDDDIQSIKNINQSFNIKVAVSLSCHLCPDVVAASQRIALLNPLVESEMLDIALFPELKDKHNILSVPALIINDEKLYFGSKKMSEIIALLK